MVTVSGDTAVPGAGARVPRGRLWAHWALTLTTLLGAGAVQLFAMGAVMSTASCNSPDCPKPSGLVYGVLTYSAPAIAVIAIGASLFTAGRRHGALVPAAAWVLLLADVAALAATFN